MTKIKKRTENVAEMKLLSLSLLELFTKLEISLLKSSQNLHDSKYPFAITISLFEKLR